MLPTGKRSLLEIRQQRDPARRLVDSVILLEFVVAHLEAQQSVSNRAGDQAKDRGPTVLDEEPTTAQAAPPEETANGAADEGNPVRRAPLSERLTPFHDAMPRPERVTAALQTHARIQHTDNLDDKGPSPREMRKANAALGRAIRRLSRPLPRRPRRQIRGSSGGRSFALLLVALVLAAGAYGIATGRADGLISAMTGPKSQARLKSIVQSGIDFGKSTWKTYQDSKDEEATAPHGGAAGDQDE